MRKNPVAIVVTVACAIFTAAPPASADSFRDRQWHLRALDIAEAHEISKGQGVTVAVVDTGVGPHPDLRNNLLSGTSVTSSADDKGQVDRDGHGTEMGSIIAGHGRGSSGVLGIAPAAKILPVRATDSNSRGDSTDSANGFSWAISHNANIISFSAGVPPSTALKKAVTAAYRSNVLVVAAAGNKGMNLVTPYPASYPGVLSVGASNRSGKPATDVSVPGSNVQICAPGVDIESAGKGTGYWRGSGTSQATAIAAGAAALVRAKFPSLSANEIAHRLTATADDIGPPGRDDQCGYGMLNIVAALTKDIPPVAESSERATPSTLAEPRSSTTTSPEAEAKGAGVNVPAIAGGVFGVLVFAGLIGFAVLRRRKR